MFQENIKGPMELLEKYKKYEYILNIDRKKLMKELFGENKAPLEELRERIKHFDQAHYDILNLSNDIIDFPLFRVMAQSMKSGLARQAEKIKEKLLEGVNKFCQESVKKISETYKEMSNLIMAEP